MESVTAEQVRQAVRERGVTAWMLRDCSICHTPLHYHFLPEYVEFDSNCACVTYWAPPQRDGYEAVADLLNRQTPDIRARMWNEMLALTTPPAAA